MELLCLSINKRFCLETKEKTLNKLEMCFKCLEIPLPYGFKSTQNQTEIYCKRCYDLQNFELKSIILPSKLELDQYKKLTINCKNFEKGCCEKFNVNTLEQMLKHEKECVLNSNLSMKDGNMSIKNPNSSCKRCKSDIKQHDCLIMNQKYCLEQFHSKFNQIEEQYNQKYLICEEKIRSLTLQLEGLEYKSNSNINETELRINEKIDYSKEEIQV